MKPVNRILPRQFCCQKGGSRQQLICLLMDLRLIVFKPEHLGRNIIRAERPPIECQNLLFPVLPVQISDLLRCAGIDSVKNGVPERHALPVHRNEIRPERAAPDSRDLLAAQTAFREDSARKCAQIAPPHFLSIMFKIPGVRILKIMRHGTDCYNLEMFIQKRRFAPGGTYIYAQIILHLLAAFTISINARIRSGSV